MREHKIQTPDERQQKTPSATLITPSLVLAYILSSFPIMLISLFITDMAQIFGVEVGIIGIARSASEIGSVVMGILLGGLSVRYRQKTLLLLGIGITCVATLTLGVVLVFPLFLVLFAFLGVSRVTIRSMSQSLVGELFPTEERPKIAGYLLVGEVGAYLIGSAISLFVPNFQSISLFFLFPLAIIVILMVLRRMPSTPLVKRNPLTAFRQVFRSRSATMMLLSNGKVFRSRSATMMLLSNGISMVSTNHCYLTFFMPLYLQKFQADRTFVTMVFSIACVIMAGIGVIAGRIIIKFGRKTIVVASSILVSLSCALMMLSPLYEVSLLGWVLAAMSVSLYMASRNNYALEQLPNYQGTMMSLNLTSQFIAQAIGSSVGGLILIGYGFEGLGWFSLLGLLAGILFQFFTIDPTRKTPSE